MTYIGPVLGLLAGVVGIADTIPYVRDTVGGSTRPHRGTWLIWSVLAIVVCLSQRADGASWSLIMAAAQAVLTSYLQKFESVYGRLPQSARDGVLKKGISPYKASDVTSPTGQTTTAIPVMLSTILIALGWLVTLPPAQVPHTVTCWNPPDVIPMGAGHPGGRPRS